MDIANDNTCAFDPWFERELICPRDRGDLQRDGDHLWCAQRHRYPIVDGIPIMLLDDVVQTAPDVTRRSLSAADLAMRSRLSYLAPVGAVDSYVQAAIVGTNGNLYGRIAGKLPRYPIPEVRLPPAREGSQDLLDLGCNWGRWSIAAARRGYRPWGVWIPVSSRYCRRGESRANWEWRRASSSAMRATFHFAPAASMSFTPTACCSISRLPMPSLRLPRQPESSRRAAPC